MKFCEYLKIMNCYIGEEKSQYDFMYELFALFISDPYTDKDIKLDENDDYYPFSSLCGVDISKKVYKGSRVLPKTISRFMIAHFYKKPFVELIEDMDETVLENLCRQFSLYGIECNIDNVADVASDCFYSFLQASLDESDTIQTGILANGEIKVEKAETTNQETLFLLEVGNKCPICNTSLMYRNAKGKNVKRYNITQIFPENVDNISYLTFSKYSKINGDYNNPDNLIALCTECSTNYLSETTEKEFLNLKKIKRTLQLRNTIQQSMDNIDLENKISDIIYSLINIDKSDNLTSLRMDALKVSQKIEPMNKLLIDSITDDVIHYYNYIEGLFADIDNRESGTFDRIASEVQLAYQKIKSNGLSQTEIFKYMSDWLKGKLPIEQQDDMAVNTVISFFVQNCEVFDEISK